MSTIGMTTPAVLTLRRLLTSLTAAPFRFCLLAWLVQRVFLQGLGAVLVAVVGVPRFARPGPFGTYFNWDSGYFSCIVHSGYLGPACPDGSTVYRFAFFPLYPLAARGVAWLSGLGTVTDGTAVFGLWFVAAVASLVAVCGLYAVVKTVTDETVARRGVVIFLASPYALFLVASYSESLYLAGAILAWWACSRRRWVWCGVFGMVATASRASGLFLIPALLVLYLTMTVRAKRSIRIGPLVAVASGGFGVLAFWAYLGVKTGDPLAWSHAQTSGWNRHTQWPWATAINQAVHMLREPRWDWQVQSWLETLFAIGLVLAVIWLLWHRYWPEATLVGLTALSLMTSTSYLSLARNTLTLFPLVWLLVTLTRDSRRGYALVLSSSVLLLTFNAVQFVLGHWAD